MPAGDDRGPGPTGDGADQVAYLRHVQYRDPTQLAKRANLHVTYRTAPRSVFAWLADLIDWPPGGGRVLDVGAGPGWLWREIAPQLPAGLRLVLSDLSSGMVTEAVPRAAGLGRYQRVAGTVGDARRLPFADGTFDLAVSTYALYHVPTPERAVDELARVVASDGQVVIATNGPRHLAEIADLRAAVFGERGRYRVNEAFPPARAAAALVERFDQVSWHRYDDILLVTDADDLLAFATSSPPADTATPEQQAELRRLIAARIERDDAFRVSKDTGVLVARLPTRSG